MTVIKGSNLATATAELGRETDRRYTEIVGFGFSTSEMTLKYFSIVCKSNQDTSRLATLSLYLELRLNIVKSCQLGSKIEDFTFTRMLIYKYCK